MFLKDVTKMMKMMSMMKWQDQEEESDTDINEGEEFILE